MIISRKKFNEAIGKAIREEADRQWQNRRIDDLGRELDSRMCRVEQRLWELENKENSRKSCGDSEKRVSPIG